jgi:hypothetical protein
MKNVGYILNETIKRHPVLDEDTIRLKSNIQLNLLSEIINDLKSNFTIIDY